MPELPSACPGPRLQRPMVQAGQRALKGSGAGSRDTAAPRRGYRARVPLASTKGPSPQPLGLPPTPDAPQGWAEGRTGIHSRLLLGSLCLPPWRATTVASGGLCSPVPLGGPRDKGPQRNHVPLPRPTRCLQGCFWKFLEPKVSVGSAHSQAAHQRPVFTVWASGTPRELDRAVSLPKPRPAGAAPNCLGAELLHHRPRALPEPASSRVWRRSPHPGSSFP